MRASAQAPAASARLTRHLRWADLDGEWLYPHHGQWGRTLPLSMCGAAVADLGEGGEERGAYYPDLSLKG